MDITPLINTEHQVINGYGEGRFRISGAVYEHPVIVLASGTRLWDVRPPVADMVIGDFAALFESAGQLDVILLGSGALSDRPSGEVRRALKERGLNVESMDTGAACRTYNVLMTEGRRVGAALLPV